MRKFPFVLSFIIIALHTSCNGQTPADAALIDSYLAQYSPYTMSFVASTYSDNDKHILKKLIQAAEYLDTLYWVQTSKYGLHLRDSLAKITDKEHTSKLLTLLNRNAGPYELLNHNAVFMGNVEYFPGQELYPRGMTAESFDAFVNKLPAEEQAQFMSPYTVIREDGKGAYTAVPYHEEYKQYVVPMAKLLRECAALTTNASFSKFLSLKADALETDNYFDADVAWIDMEGSPFDIVFGPFETYSDEIKGVKAKYEASIEVIDQEESKKLEIYKQYLKEMEENLPIPREYKSEVKGLTAQFVIVRDIMRKGEAAAGYQAVATNLPNDPEVHEKKGTKKTFWKNMFEARFNTIIKPVSMKLIDPSQQEYLSDYGFFLDVLLHEICHAVGPRTVKVGPNKGMAANASIGPDYNGLEENKADMAGLHSLAMLIDKGVIDPSMEKKVYVSFLGSLFRSIRFGLDEAHGKAAAVELNYLWKNGGILYNQQSKTWSVDFANIREGVKKITAELLILEGNGDGTKVKEFFDRWTYMTPELQSSLDRVKDIAIDVLPEYSITWE
jgi:hypothetical protein